MGSAQLDRQPEEQGTAALEMEASSAVSALRQQAAERLAAHRERRRQAAAKAAAPVMMPQHAGQQRVPRRKAGASAAERVAERYARTPSFRAALADEARRAMEQAAAEAEVALRNAEAVAAAQQELLAELIQYDMQVNFTPDTAVVVSAQPAVLADPPSREVQAGGLTVKLYEDAGRPPGGPPPPTQRRTYAPADTDETKALDEEIAFRQAPVFEDYAALLQAAIATIHEPTTPLPANLLEFPRQLVASKKARPRLAEGPLREDAATSPQLRIFEVESKQAVDPPEALHAAPEWSCIRLDAHIVTDFVEDAQMPTPDLLPSLLPPQVAPMQLRLMALAADATLVLAGFIGFAAAAAEIALRSQAGFEIPKGIPAVSAAAFTLAVLWFTYQFLFFTLAGQTPGMQYARIGLCTFSDENPSRSAMRKRVLAQIVAACPLGLGIVWALLDEERLGWHDRISRMYQRAY